VNGPVFVTGHRGLLGSALRHALSGREVLTASRGELDLRGAAAVRAFIGDHKPAVILHAAARNAGIALHEREPAAMLADNLAVALHVIQTAAELRVPRLLFVSSAAIYAAGELPPEEGALQKLPGGPTAGYALAKIAGMALCDAVRRQHGLTFHSIIPCNLYGPGDNYHPAHATVVAGMMRRMDEAARAGDPAFPVWGSGQQTREFLHAADLADACRLLLETADPPPRANCGTGLGTSMRELAALLKDLTGYRGRVTADPSKPEGAPRPALQCDLLHRLGWQPQVTLEDGLRSTYAAFLEAKAAGTLRA